MMDFLMNKKQEEKILVKLSDKLMSAIMSFYGNNQDLKLVVENVFGGVIENCEIDENKFIKSLNIDHFTTIANNPNYLESQLVRVDRDGSNNPVLMKSFLSKGNPYIYFYNESQTLPFLKIKHKTKDSVLKFDMEVASAPELLTSNDLNAQKRLPYMYLNDGYEIVNSLIFERKKLDLKTEKSKGSEDNQNFEEKHQAFFDFLNDSISSGVSIKNLSYESKNVLAKNFYDVVQNLFIPEFDFTLDELIKIADSTLNVKYSNSDIDIEKPVKTSNIVDAICLVNPGNFNHPYLKEIIVDGGKNISKISIAKNVKCLTMSLFGKDNKALIKYLICSTNKGWTIYRHICEPQVKGKTIIPACSINLTDNELKFTTFAEKNSNELVNCYLDILVNFNRDGSLKFDSNNYSLTTLENEQKSVENPKMKS